MPIILSKRVRQLPGGPPERSCGSDVPNPTLPDEYDDDEDPDAPPPLRDPPVPIQVPHDPGPPPMHVGFTGANRAGLGLVRHTP